MAPHFRWILGLLLGTGIAEAENRLRPTFPSEVVAPAEKVILPLLKAACGDGVRTATRNGKTVYGCGDDMEEVMASRQRPRRYPWMPDVLWEADGVLFGHLLSPTSDDAVVNCFGCGSHPDLFGGGLLLTRQSGEWRPVWFKRGIIVRHCRRITLATGRQILFCEETDGGMGHAFHFLYTVDFAKPKFAWDSTVLIADNYGDPMLGGVQRQFIDRVEFDESGPGALRVRVQARHGRLRLRPDSNVNPLPEPKLSRHEIDLQLDGERLQATPATSAAISLFRPPASR